MLKLEEACGDMNQRGGAICQAIGEPARKRYWCRYPFFCSAPAHALLVAAALVKASTAGVVVGAVRWPSWE